MNPETYARVLYRLADAGMGAQEAVAAVHASLAARGSIALWPQITKLFKNIAERSAREKEAVITIADERDLGSVKHELEKDGYITGGQGVRVRIDQRIIGGWQFEYGEEYVDNSYKYALENLYAHMVHTYGQNTH
jgi:F0F1-type ATP synthase delta subunit